MTSNFYTLRQYNRFTLYLRNTNSAASALTLDVNGTGAKPLYINGAVSSASNYTLPAGTYEVYYDGANYYVRTDEKRLGSIEGNAQNVEGVVPISHGGTGATTAEQARQNLGITGGGGGDSGLKACTIAIASNSYTATTDEGVCKVTKNSNTQYTIEWTPTGEAKQTATVNVSSSQITITV